MERIVVGVDGSETAQRALQWAVDEARRRSAVVEAIYAWREPFVVGYAYMGEWDMNKLTAEAETLLAEAVDAVDTTGVTVERKVMTGGPAQVLVEQAKGAALLVVGSRGRGGFSGLLLGSISQQAAHHAPCPIVIIPPAG
ncbi:MAG: universal stress protein [Actinomycetota bacterium]|jgi:nucleotide-binding universal stress UspA family protein